MPKFQYSLLRLSIIICATSVFTPSTTAKDLSINDPAAIEVKDYKSFTIYNSQLPQPPTLRNKTHVDKNKIIFPNKTTYQLATLKDGRIIEEGFISSNGAKVAVFNQGADSFDVFNNTGTKISSTILKDLPSKEGVTFAFSDSRIFIIPESLYGCEGFEIRTSTGGLIRDLDICDMAGYTVSYDQRLFLVGSMNVGANCFFRIYDMDGIEVWKHKIHHASSVKFELSFDNRFAAVKLPEYWIYKNESDPYHSTRKENKLYIFDIVEQKLISEEDYTQ